MSAERESTDAGKDPKKNPKKTKHPRFEWVLGPMKKRRKEKRRRGNFRTKGAQ